MKVTDSAGQYWRVSRRWLPWDRRVRDAADDLPTDIPDIDVGDLEGIIALVLFIALFVLIVVGLLWIGVILELVALVVLLPFAVIARVVFRRPWTVEVYGPGTRFLRRGPLYSLPRTVGWRASGRLIRQSAAERQTNGGRADR